MIDLPGLRQFFSEYVKNSPDIEGFVFAVDVSNAIARLNNKSGVQLLVVYPSSEDQGSTDNASQMHELLFMVLERGNRESKDEMDEFEQYVRLRNIIDRLKQSISDACSEGNRLWYRLSGEGSRVEPEYNIKDWNGWNCNLIF